MQVQRKPHRVLPAVSQVYRELTRHLEDRNFEEHHHLRSLGEERCIWTGSCFADPASTLLQGSPSLEPALYSAEASLAANFKPLLLLLGVSASSPETTQVSGSLCASQ